MKELELEPGGYMRSTARRYAFTFIGKFRSVQVSYLLGRHLDA